MYANSASKHIEDINPLVSTGLGLLIILGFVLSFMVVTERKYLKNVNNTHVRSHEVNKNRIVSVFKTRNFSNVNEENHCVLVIYERSLEDPMSDCRIVADCGECIK